MILIYVSSDINVQKSKVSKFLAQFEGTGFSLKWYLAARIHMDSECLFISQNTQDEKALTTFGLENCRTCSTPMVSNSFDECLQHASDEAVGCENTET